MLTSLCSLVAYLSFPVHQGHYSYPIGCSVGHIFKSILFCLFDNRKNKIFLQKFNIGEMGNEQSQQIRVFYCGQECLLTASEVLKLQEDCKG